ncbi:SdpI family protein [Enterococcus sp. BWR-S5]|uniref:SdpI family protein n=1 Tax=Enterococcus sp. BWR-S5 TaxID=2787714 RepID=UPI001920F081|nr:SdpI family protein [Enterococcus sp. BWR-S5]MBL1224563.1 SdpI family protein [Enterococcus sp. BWR-S5]
MKSRAAMLKIFSTTPLLLLGFLPFMKEQFAWQYELDGVPARFGSRYELIVFVLIPVAIGWGCYFWVARGERGGMQKNGRFVMSLATVIVFLLQALVIWILFAGMGSNTSFPESGITITTNFTLYFVGILLLVYGNQLPRASFKSAFGFKNVWSISNEKTWIYSQKLVGILCMACGMIIILLNLLLPINNFAVILLVPIGVFVLGSYLLSYIAYVKTNA